MLLKTSVYVKSYDGKTKQMCFLIGDDDLLEKYNSIWDKVSVDIIRWECQITSLSLIKVLKTKIKSHSDEVADCYDKEIPKLDSNHTCLAVISQEDYYLSFFKECRCITKKVVRHIMDDLESSSGDSDDSDDANEE